MTRILDGLMTAFVVGVVIYALTYEDKPTRRFRAYLRQAEVRRRKSQNARIIARSMAT
jgi:hypothetical protein